MIALVSDDPVGKYLNPDFGMSLDDAERTIRGMADRAGMDHSEFFKLLKVFAAGLNTLVLRTECPR